jgi:hypothetical protein
VLASAAAFVVSLCAFASMGTVDAGVAILTALDRLTVSGGAAAAYLVAGVGIGRLLRPLWRGAGDPLALQVAGGLAVMLWVSHLLGWLGLFRGPAGAAVAIAPVAVGCVLALHQLFMRLRGAGIEIAVSPFAVLTAPGVALLLVAACNPPGALWGSEFGGYDVLEYHLELPQEWLAMGRVAPVAHNVYSYLPSYLEAAYTHLGAMTMAPLHASDGGGVGLAAGEGYRLISCQLLHAGFALIAAWLTARLVRGFVGEGARAQLAPALAFSLVLLTPWTIVTGSMAYNEMAMVAMFAGALVAACDGRLSDAKRSALAGLLVGAACSVKPTALLFVGVPAAVMLLGMRPRLGRLLTLVAPGAVAGLVVLAPWLIRNYLAAHNPVFPFAASLFGNGDWTAEQVARYAGAHRFHGSVVDRLRLLVMADPAPTQKQVSAQRGLLHPQFGVLFLVVAVALGVQAFRKLRDSRQPHPGPPLGGEGGRGALLLAVVLFVQLLLWLSVTHLQARFLIPLVVPAVALNVVAGSLLLRTRAWPVLFLLPLAQLACSVVIFSNERGGKPNSMLIQGPGLRTGTLVRELPAASQREWIENASPELFINVVLKPEARVYLLGDSTPLYVTRPVLYNTTYDRWPIGGDPGGWSAALRGQHVDYVLVNLGEVGRLERSGWLPPDVSLDAVKEWLVNHTMVVRAWEQLGVYLVRPIEPPHSPHDRPTNPAPQAPPS